MLKLTCTFLIAIAAVAHSSVGTAINPPPFTYASKNYQLTCSLTVEDTEDTTIPRKIYYLGTERKLDWYSAHYDCRNMGLKLLEIQTFEDFIDVKLFLHDKGMTHWEYWTSGNNLEDNSKWRWGISADSPDFSFTNWAPGEPNNADNDENCLQTRAGSLEWNDSNCYDRSFYICEKESENFKAMRNNVTETIKINETEL